MVPLITTNYDAKDIIGLISQIRTLFSAPFSYSFLKNHILTELLHIYSVYEYTYSIAANKILGEHFLRCYTVSTVVIVETGDYLFKEITKFLLFEIHTVTTPLKYRSFFYVKKAQLSVSNI